MNLSLAPEQGGLAMNIESKPSVVSSGCHAATPGGARLGYLTSRYPAVSHTFILREIAQLRAAGFEIHSASVNEPERAS